MEGGRGEVGDEIVVEFSVSHDVAVDRRGVVCIVIALRKGNEACINIDWLAIAVRNLQE